MKIKFHRNSTPEKLDIYELKVGLFDNGDTEELFLFVRNFKVTIEALVTLADNANIYYLQTLLHVEALRELKYLCVQIGSKTMTHLNQFMLGLGTVV